MKSNRNFFNHILAVLAFSVLITSCNDDFSEEDLLRLQSDIRQEEQDEAAAQALAALDEAGSFYELTVTVNNDDALVSGVSVTLHGQGSGDITQTTGDNGSTTFSGARSGGNIITLAADGFAGAILNISLPPLQEGVNYEVTPDGTYIPIRTGSSIIAPLFATGDNGSTGTIRGRVEIETDVTNETPEVPQGIQVVATLDDLSASVSVRGGATADKYQFDNSNNKGFGTATVDNTTGEFTMTVPASADGLPINIEVPNIEVNQRIAVAFENGVDLDRPEYRDVMTNFGPAFQFQEQDLPVINGAIAIFDEPAAPGTGFSLTNFQRVPDALHGLNVDRGNNDITLPYDAGNLVVQFNSFGAGYTSSPTVTITDASGTGARAEAHVEFAIGGVTVGTAGSGYGANEIINMNFIAEQRFDDGTTADVPFTTLQVTASATGAIGQTQVSAAVNDAIENGFFAFNPDQTVYVSIGGSVLFTGAFNSPDEMEGIRVEFQHLGADPTVEVTGTPSLSVGRVFSLDITDTGENYVDPSFAFSGGGATSQASMEVLSYATQWTFDLDNSSAAGYNSLPSDIYFEYNAAAVDFNNSLNTVSGNTDVQELLFGDVQGSRDFIDDLLLAPNGTGGLEYVDNISTYRTDFFAVEAPEIRVVNRETETAFSWVDVSSEGEIDGFVFASTGNGYEQEFGVTIEPSAAGAPGSGAVIELNGGQLANGEFSWFGAFSVLSGGSGYLEDLNVQNSIGGREFFGFTAGSSNVNVKTGDVVVVNINYGTGVRQVDVDGNWNF